MNLKLQEKLKQYHNEGYKILINDTAYLDSFVTHIQRGEQGREDGNGDPMDENEYYYDSNVFEDRPLKEVSSSHVEVFMEMEKWEVQTVKSIKPLE